MNSPFLIIFDDTQDKNNLELFFEAIRSSYVSKKGNKFSFIISAPSDSKTEQIYKLIETQIDSKIQFIVISFNNFYGNFPDGVFAWIKDTFPNVQLISALRNSTNNPK